MANDTALMVAGIYFVLIAAALCPAVLAALAVRHLKGWMRVVSVPLLLFGLTALPGAWIERISIENKPSPDAGGILAVMLMMLIAIVLTSALIGFAIGGILLYFRARGRTRDATARF